tara:strand:- start:34 stop:291 length:258 start_codon:yes stop_codon:yes gene_type:complete
MVSVSELVNNLKEGVVEVTYEKVDGGGTRVMPCTLNPAIILEESGSSITVSSVSGSSADIPVWGMDVKAWRSFRTNTVTGWKLLW